MSVQSDVAQIKENLRFLPMKIDELRGDILRLAESFNEEMESEKKSGESLRILLLNLQRELQSSKGEAEKENQTPDRSSPDRGLLKFLN